MKSLKKSQALDWSEVLICVEFTGIYTIDLMKAACKYDLRLWLETPLHVKRSLGIQRGKSDSVDAMRLAEYASRFYDKAQCNAPTILELQPLRELINLRERFVKSLKMIGAHPKELASIDKKAAKPLRDVSDPVIKSIREQIEVTNRKIDEFLRSKPEFFEMSQLIQSVPGIGPITAAVLILTTWNFQRLCDAKKLATYGCMAPFGYTSGTSIHSKSKTSKMGDKRLKTLLQLAVYNAIKSDKELREYYHKKVAEGKPKLLVANNIRNKLLKRVIAVVKRNSPYAIHSV